jgi:hypothetical protein
MLLLTTLGNGLKAFDLTAVRWWTAMTINVEDATAKLIYLTGATNPVKDLRALTIADSTFLVNKKKTVAKAYRLT